MRAAFTARGITSVGSALAGAFLAVIVIISDIADREHAVWRDPISYLGSSDAPYPAWVNLALAVVGASLTAWSLVRVREHHRAPVVIAGGAGVALVLLALFPIDCSPVDDLCEVLIRGRLVSTSHDVHSVVGLVFFGLLAAIGVIAGWRLRRSASAWTRALGLAAAVVGPLCVVAIVARPFGSGAGIIELIAVVAATSALALSRRVS